MILLIAILNLYSTGARNNVCAGTRTLLEVIPETTEHLLILQEWSSSKRYVSA
jgi:hypothetical protein